MNNFKFTRKMQTVVKHRLTLVLSVMLIIFVICLVYGGSANPLDRYKFDNEHSKWYEGKDLKLVHVVSNSMKDI